MSFFWLILMYPLFILIYFNRIYLHIEKWSFFLSMTVCRIIALSLYSIVTHFTTIYSNVVILVCRHSWSYNLLLLLFYPNWQSKWAINENINMPWMGLSHFGYFISPILSFNCLRPSTSQTEQGRLPRIYYFF